MNNSTARFLSRIMHPAFIPSVFLFIVLNTGPLSTLVYVGKAKWIILSIVFVFTCLMPLITAYVLKLNHSITSFEMPHREERMIPFLTTGIYYLACYYLFKELLLPKIFTISMLGCTLAVVLALLINVKWKISAHLTGMGCLTGILAGMHPHLHEDLLMPLSAMLVLSGLLGTARLILHAHSPAQVYAGFFSGFFSTWILLNFFW